MSELVFFVANSAAQLALTGLILERLKTMSTQQDAIKQSIESATADLAATRAQVEKIAGEQAGLISKIDELTTALANTDVQLPEGILAAVDALNVEVANLKGAVESVDAKVQDAAPV